MRSLLNHLLAQYAPTGVVYVGAGNGDNDLVNFLADKKINQVVLVESDDDQYSYLNDWYLLSESINQLNWQLLREVVSHQTQDIQYYICNKCTENGLVDPRTLTNIWPNIKLKQSQILQAISLSDIYSQQSNLVNWLLIDCLGAELIVEFNQELNNIDVLVLRLLVSDEVNADSILENAEHSKFNTYSDFKRVHEQLAQISLKHIASFNTLHPNIMHAVFSRDFKQHYKKLEGKAKKQTEEISKLRAKVIELEASLSHQHSYNVTLQDELNNLEKSINIFSLLEDANED